MTAETTATLAKNELAHSGIKFPALNVPTHSVPILLHQPEKHPAVHRDLGEGGWLNQNRSPGKHLSQGSPMLLTPQTWLVSSRVVWGSGWNEATTDHCSSHFLPLPISKVLCPPTSPMSPGKARAGLPYTDGQEELGFHGHKSRGLGVPSA